MSDIDELLAFLSCRTPQGWLDKACEHPELLLTDHANCEKKAASTALNILYRYVAYPELLQKMSRLAREELRHFEQVLGIMTKRGIVYEQLTAGRYAGVLRKEVRQHEPAKLVDTLIMGAIIEARSCERFYSLAPLLDEELNHFYRSLLKSEARHFQDYLYFAKKYSPEDIAPRVRKFLDVEQDLILSPDDEFRFHSGNITH